MIWRTHNQEILLFRELICVWKSLKHQLINTIDPIYVTSTKNEFTGFNNINVIQIMYDLYTSYGKIDDIELEKNKVTIMIVYTPKMTMAIITNKFG